MKGGKGGVAGGKGLAGGCWHCGGNHYMSECPRGGGKAFQLSEWFPPECEWSGETTELAKSVVALNVFREKAQEVQEDGSQIVRCHQHRHQRMWCQDHGRTRLVARHLNHKRPMGAALFVSMVADTTWEGRNKAPWEIGW